VSVGINISTLSYLIQVEQLVVDLHHPLQLLMSCSLVVVHVFLVHH